MRRWSLLLFVMLFILWVPRGWGNEVSEARDQLDALEQEYGVLKSDYSDLEIPIGLTRQMLEQMRDLRLAIDAKIDDLNQSLLQSQLLQAAFAEDEEAFAKAFADYFTTTDMDEKVGAFMRLQSILPPECKNIEEAQELLRYSNNACIDKRLSEFANTLFTSRRLMLAKKVDSLQWMGDLNATVDETLQEAQTYDQIDANLKIVLSLYDTFTPTAQMIKAIFDPINEAYYAESTLFNQYLDYCNQLIADEIDSDLLQDEQKRAMYDWLVTNKAEILDKIAQIDALIVDAIAQLQEARSMVEEGYILPLQEKLQVLERAALGLSDDIETKVEQISSQQQTLLGLKHDEAYEKFHTIYSGGTSETEEYTIGLQDCSYKYSWVFVGATFSALDAVNESDNIIRVAADAFNAAIFGYVGAEYLFSLFDTGNSGKEPYTRYLANYTHNRSCINRDTGEWSGSTWYTAETLYGYDTFAPFSLTEDSVYIECDSPSGICRGVRSGIDEVTFTVSGEIVEEAESVEENGRNVWRITQKVASKQFKRIVQVYAFEPEDFFIAPRNSDTQILQAWQEANIDSLHLFNISQNDNPASIVKEKFGLYLEVPFKEILWQDGRFAGAQSGFESFFYNAIVVEDATFVDDGMLRGYAVVELQVRGVRVRDVTLYFDRLDLVVNGQKITKESRVPVANSYTVGVAVESDGAIEEFIDRYKICYSITPWGEDTEVVCKTFRETITVPGVSYQFSVSSVSIDGLEESEFLLHSLWDNFLYRNTIGNWQGIEFATDYRDPTTKLPVQGNLFAMRRFALYGMIDFGLDGLFGLANPYGIDMWLYTAKVPNYRDFSRYIPWGRAPYWLFNLPTTHASEIYFFTQPLEPERIEFYRSIPYEWTLGEEGIASTFWIINQLYEEVPMVYRDYSYLGDYHALALYTIRMPVISERDRLDSDGKLRRGLAVMIRGPVEPGATILIGQNEYPIERVYSENIAWDEVDVPISDWISDIVSLTLREGNRSAEATYVPIYRTKKHFVYLDINGTAAKTREVILSAQDSYQRPMILQIDCSGFGGVLLPPGIDAVAGIKNIVWESDGVHFDVGRYPRKVEVFGGNGDVWVENGTLYWRGEGADSFVIDVGDFLHRDYDDLTFDYDHIVLYVTVDPSEQLLRIVYAIDSFEPLNALEPIGVEIDTVESDMVSLVRGYLFFNPLSSGGTVVIGEHSFDYKRVYADQLIAVPQRVVVDKNYFVHQLHQECNNEPFEIRWMEGIALRKLDGTQLQTGDTFTCEEDLELEILDYATASLTLRRSQWDEVMQMDFVFTPWVGELPHIVAYDPQTGEEREFETQAAIPEGWIEGAAPDNDGDGINDILDLDDDNDGISDIIEAAVGLDPLFADGTFDYDNDGFSNLEEIASGTDPYVVETFEGPRLSVGWNLVTFGMDINMSCLMQRLPQNSFAWAFDEGWKLATNMDVTYEQWLEHIASNEGIWLYLSVEVDGIDMAPCSQQGEPKAIGAGWNLIGTTQRIYPADLQRLYGSHIWVWKYVTKANYWLVYSDEADINERIAPYGNVVLMQSLQPYDGYWVYIPQETAP